MWYVSAFAYVFSIRRLTYPTDLLGQSSGWRRQRQRENDTRMPSSGHHDQPWKSHRMSDPLPGREATHQQEGATDPSIGDRKVNHDFYDMYCI
jgi:hypothetical protein